MDKLSYVHSHKTFHSPLCIFFSLGGGVRLDNSRRKGLPFQHVSSPTVSFVAEQAAFPAKMLQEGFPNTARISPVCQGTATEFVLLNL